LKTSADLKGATILIVEDEPLIALDLKATLEAAGASVTCCRADDAVRMVGAQAFSAAVLDARPGSSEHRPIARQLRDSRVPFLFYSTQAPEDVTTVRGAPVVLKPGRPQEIVAAVALLLRRSVRP
jgi:DNA-binding response OmpR family regulator